MPWNMPSGHGWRVTLPRYAWPAVHEFLVTNTGTKHAAANVDGQIVVSLSREHLDAIENLLPASATVERETQETP